MGMFKDRVLVYVEGILSRAREIHNELRRIREENELQTLMLRRIADNQTSANKKPNKPQEVAPAPKTITWQEAVKTLRDLCKVHRYCADCPAKAWCDKALPPNMSVIAPNGWEVPGDE